MLQRYVTRTPYQHLSRALAKTVCYRIFMVMITVSVAWIIVGDVSQTLNIGLITNLLKSGTYYAYERIWDRITWGVPNQ